MPVRKQHIKIDDRLFMYMEPYPAREPWNRKNWGKFGLSCQHICGTSYLRPHFSSLHCFIRKVWYGKIPPVIELQQYGVVGNKHRSWWKKILFRWIWSIVEYLVE